MIGTGFRNRGARITYTAKRLEAPKDEAGIIGLLQAADLGITKIERLPIDPEFAERLERALRILDGLEEESRPGQELRFLPDDLVRLHHMSAEGPVAVDPEHESQGTLAWVGMLGPTLAHREERGRWDSALLDGRVPAEAR